MFERLSRLFTSEQPTFSLRLGFGQRSCVIDHQSNLPFPSRDYSVALIATWVSYVARYFYICDERQVQPIREYLVSSIPQYRPWPEALGPALGMTTEELRTAKAEGKNLIELAHKNGVTTEQVSAIVKAGLRTLSDGGLPWIFFGNFPTNAVTNVLSSSDEFIDVLYRTLSEDQRKAAVQTFSSAPLIPIGVGESPIEKPQTTYTFKIVIPENGGLISSNLDMPFFSASVLLPAFGLAQVYYLCRSLLSQDDFETLNDVTMALLRHYEQVDCRNRRVFMSAPTELLRPLLK